MFLGQELKFKNKLCNLKLGTFFSALPGLGASALSGRVGQNLRNRACGAKLAKLQYYMISSMHISVGVTGRSPSSLIFWKSKQIPILYACGIWARNLS